LVSFIGFPCSGCTLANERVIAKRAGVLGWSVMLMLIGIEVALVIALRVSGTTGLG